MQLKLCYLCPGCNKEWFALSKRDIPAICPFGGAIGVDAYYSEMVDDDYELTEEDLNPEAFWDTPKKQSFDNDDLSDELDEDDNESETGDEMLADDYDENELDETLIDDVDSLIDDEDERRRMMEEDLQTTDWMDSSDSFNDPTMIDLDGDGINDFLE